MGLLSTAAKVARIANKIDVPDTPSVPTQSSIPKSKMNPLVKKRNLVDDIDTDFYSPVLSTIEQMTIGKKGSKGENVSAFLQKRAPNVAKSELESFELNLDPQRLYNREELIELAKEKGSTKYLIEEVDSNKVDTFEDDQRQFVQDEEVNFVTLTLQGEKDYLRGEYDAHFGGTKNLGHTRSSIRRELPIEGKETNDNNEYLLIEEIQSDTAKKRSADNDKYSTLGTTDVDTERDIDAYLFDTFDDLDFEFQEDYDVDIPRDIVDTIKKFYKDMYTSPELTSLGDVSIQKKLLKNRDALKKILKDKHGINAEGLDTDKISHTAIRDNFSGDDIENPYLSEKLEDGITFLNSEIVDHFTEKFKVTDIKKSPVLSRSDYLKKLILSNIVYAKKNNLNKIVIPNYKEIARQRTSTFDEVVSEDSPYYAKYIEAMKTGDHGKVAQEYFEGVFKKTYKDALDKVLNTLKKESNNTIEIKNRELRYGDLTQKDRYRTSNATEIDISKFEFDPTTEKLRFNKGGTPMEKQMELFEDGGLKDEGGMVDEQSGNDVPVGSSRKEVRDDIPAMLSEGEFVFPADVVRYHGLDKLMELRQEAKMGLKQMEAMGQMGNSEEATMSDDMPFGPSNLVIVGGSMEDEPREMAEGGVVYANQGTFATGISGSQPSIYAGSQTPTTYAPPPSSVAPPTPAPSPAGGYMPRFVTDSSSQFFDPAFEDVTSVDPETETGVEAQTAANTSPGVNTASTEDNFLPTVADKYTSVTYINKETGQKRDFYFYNGNPVIPITDGFVPYDETADETVSDLESTTVETTQVTSGSDDPPPTETPKPVEYGKMKDAELKKAYSQNQTAVAIMAGLTAVNPIFGLFGSWATRSTGNTITEEMKKRGIKVPESTGIKGVFDNIIDGVKDMLGLDDDQTTAVKSAVEKDNSPPKIYTPKDPTKGSFSTDSSTGTVTVTPSKSVQDSVTIVDKDPMEQFGGTGPVISSSSTKDNSPPKNTSVGSVDAAQSSSQTSSFNKANEAKTQKANDDYTASKVASFKETNKVTGGFKQGGLATRKKKK